MLPEARDWFVGSSSHWTDWPAAAVHDMKAGERISVVIPARDEAPTIGGIVAGIRQDLMVDVPVVDELIVIDSDSTDDTAEVAERAGATVCSARDVRPDLGTYPGKGEALWKSQFVATGDILVFVDADLTGWGTHFVTGLLGPALRHRSLLIKGYYDRILDDGSGAPSVAGGRVTELVARPLLNLRWPHLASVVQPLAGEWAIRRAAFEQLSVPVGYGVELAAVLDVTERWGLSALAQVDLGERAHVHQAEHDLGLMAAEILLTAARRAGVQIASEPSLAQFVRHGDPSWRERPVPSVERPPAVTVAGYRT